MHIEVDDNKFNGPQPLLNNYFRRWFFMTIHITFCSSLTFSYFILSYIIYRSSPYFYLLRFAKSENKSTK